MNIDGVEAAQVDLTKGEAVVSGEANREDLIKAVEEVGYTAQ